MLKVECHEKLILLKKKKSPCWPTGAMERSQMVWARGRDRRRWSGGCWVAAPWWQKGEDNEDDIQQTGPGGPSGENVQVRESGLMTNSCLDQWVAMLVCCEHRRSENGVLESHEMEDDCGQQNDPQRYPHPKPWILCPGGPHSKGRLKLQMELQSPILTLRWDHPGPSGSTWYKKMWKGRSERQRDSTWGRLDGPSLLWRWRKPPSQGTQVSTELQ